MEEGHKLIPGYRVTLGISTLLLLPLLANAVCHLVSVLASELML